jgi:hypothetical protein
MGKLYILLFIIGIAGVVSCNKLIGYNCENVGGIKIMVGGRAGCIYK